MISLLLLLANWDGDAFPDAIDLCLFWPSTENVECDQIEREQNTVILETQRARGVTLPSGIVLITNLWEQTGPFVDTDDDGINDYYDPCIETAGTCQYDLNGDGKVNGKDWRMCRAADCGFTRDEWRAAKEAKLLRGPGCEYVPGPLAGQAGTSVCVFKGQQR